MGRPCAGLLCLPDCLPASCTSPAALQGAKAPLPFLPAPLRCTPCLQVLVLRLKTVGTVEERVVEAASDKAQLADRSITGGCPGGTVR